MPQETTRAKVRVNAVRQSKTDQGEVWQEHVIMNPVYSPDPASENRKFWEATPAGEVNLFINNPQVFGLFQEGQEVYLDMTIIEKPAT